MFYPRKATKFRDVLDGLANSIMAGELNTALGDNHVTTRVAEANGILHDPSICDDQVDPERPNFWAPGTDFASNNREVQRGYKWMNGMCVNTGITTITPPNSPVCSNGNNTFTIGIYGPSSRHQGGCHILMGDGAVIFITESIEAGDQTHGNIIWNGMDSRSPGSKSPYGLWGALGTIAMSETISEQLNQ